jgi:Sulfotransferase domain
MLLRIFILSGGRSKGVKRPNFLIIGAARSGSTSLARCLALHPSVYLPAAEGEPKFFSREQEYRKGSAYYLNTYFSVADDYLAVGEKSTEYMENQRSAERIYHFDHEMKILCILRNPVERAISNYWWSVYNGLEKRQLNLAIEQEWDRFLNHPSGTYALSSSRPHAYIDRGLYYRNLQPFYSFFHDENIKCIIFEDFIRNKWDTIQNLLLFLNVPVADLNPLDFAVAPQRAVPQTDTLGPNLYRNLKRFYRDENKGLPDLIGKDIGKFWDSE